LHTRVNASRKGERGSLAPLGTGLALLSLATVLVVIASGSLYLTERRLTGVAESTALAVAETADGDLSQNLAIVASDYLGKLPLRGLHQVSLVEASSQDMKTVRIRLCSVWRPIFENYIFSEIGRVCSEGLARRGR
jgi:uncharacterized membrane protein